MKGWVGWVTLLLLGGLLSACEGDSGRIGGPDLATAADLRDDGLPDGHGDHPHDHDAAHEPADGADGAADLHGDQPHTHDVAQAPADAAHTAEDGDEGSPHSHDAGAGPDTRRADLAAPAGDADGSGSGCLGTVYPDLAVIDPDDPSYADGDHTAEEVRAMFAVERADDTQTYRAYRAAHTWPDLIECAFCACGCATGLGHVSALDCFKDLHGFT